MTDPITDARDTAETELTPATAAAFTAYLDAVELALLGDDGVPPQTGQWPSAAQLADILSSALLEPLVEAYLRIWDAGTGVLDALTLPEGDIAAVLAAWVAVRESSARSHAAERLERLAGFGDQVQRVVLAALEEASGRGERSTDQQRRAAADAIADAYPGMAGDWRVERVARTEATAAAGAAVAQQADTLAQTLTATGSDTEVLKQWVTRHDERVRHAHAGVHGQTVGLAAVFLVGGYPMRYPGDPLAPPELTINCRCHLTIITRSAGQAALTAGGTMSYRPTVSMRRDDPGQDTALAARAHDAHDARKAARLASGQPQELPDGWRGVLAPLDTLSGDGRLLASAAGLRTRPYPLPFLAQEALSAGHDGAVNIGRTDRVWVEGDNLMGEGPFDLGDPEGQAWARRFADGFAGGVSVDLDDVIFSEHFYDRTTGEELDPEDAIEIMWFGEDPEQVEYQLHMDDWRLIGHTAVYQPAFYQAKVEPVFGYELSGEIVEHPAERTSAATIAEAAASRRAAAASASAALLAAGVPAGPQEPPAAWFDSPALPGPTPITVDDDGRVYGHIALFSSCHVGSPDVCIAPPRTRTDYSLFHTGEIVTREGRRLSVGRMTVGGGHADAWDSVGAAIEHYDNTGAVVAIVRAYEDAHGILVAGALHPAATKQQVADFLLSPPSGDWRRVGANLELVAVLSVNTPGYPVTRPRAAASGDRQVSLVASGVAPVNGRDGRIKVTSFMGPERSMQLSATLARSMRRMRIEQIHAGLNRPGDPWALTRATLERLDPASGAYALALASARRHGYQPTGVGKTR